MKFVFNPLAGKFDNVSNQIADINGLQTALDSKQPLDSTLTSLAAFNTNGILTQTAADTFTARTITGTTNQITVTNGNGVSGNPTLSLPQNIHTAATPTFAGLTALTGNITFADGARDINLAGNSGSLRFYAASALTSTPDGTAIQFFGINRVNFQGQFFLDSGAHNNAAVIIRTAPTSGTITERWRVDSSGHFLTGLDNAYDIGASGATRPRTGYFATSVDVAAGKIILNSTSVTLADAVNIIAGTTTGTKIGTSATQKLGFFNSTPVVKPTVTGSRGGNAALASLLTQLASLGLVVDSTTA